MSKKKQGGRSETAKALGKSYLIFLSHATHDKWIAKILCEKIEQAGADTFRDDRDIQGGDSIPKTIKENMQKCDELLVLLTPESVGREWVLIEIGIAIGVERRIVPLLYHVDAEKIPAIIKDNRWFELSDVDDYLEDLRKRLSNR